MIIEPTGAAWLPVAVFFIRRGHVVHRVSSAKAAALRRFLSQHAKANSIDAEALARLAIVDPDGLQRLQLAEGPAASLDRRVRAADRLTETATRHKVRLRELARQAMPMLDEAITGELTAADVAVLERYGDPRALLRVGLVRLTALIRKASRGHHGEERAKAWRAVAGAALDLYGDDPAVPFGDLAAEMATEARLLRAVLAERDGHARQREVAYRQVDPAGLARSLPGVADIGGPVLVAAMGDPHRFPDGAAFKRFTGLTPGRLRPATPTARARPCARPDPGGSATSSSSRPTPPGASTPNSPRCTSPRWSNAAPTTKKPSASSPPASPNGPGWSCPGASPTPSATSTAPPSPRPRPGPSSRSATASPRTSGAGADHGSTRGRPLTKCSRHMHQVRHVTASTNEATFPATPPKPTRHPESSPRQPPRPGTTPVP